MSLIEILIVIILSPFVLLAAYTAIVFVAVLIKKVMGR